MRQTGLQIDRILSTSRCDWVLYIVVEGGAGGYDCILLGEDSRNCFGYWVSVK